MFQFQGPIEFGAQLPKWKLYANEHHFSSMNAGYKKEKNISNNNKQTKYMKKTSNASNAINRRRNSFLDDKG